MKHIRHGAVRQQMRRLWRTRFGSILPLLLLLDTVFSAISAAKPAMFQLTAHGSGREGRWETPHNSVTKAKR